MDNQSAFQTQPAYVQKASNRKRLVIIFLVVLVLIIAALGALYLLGSSAKHPTSAPTAPVPTAAIVATPTPASSSANLTPTAGATASPTPGLSALSVSVLNGSGVVGAASQTATALKTAGFTNVTTGNASAYTYTGITIHVKNKANLATVEKAVATVNPNAKITSGVDPTLPTDVEVIVGK